MGRDNRDGRSENSRGDRSYGGRDFSRRSFGGGRDFTKREKFKAVCDACGRDCEVPFRPTGGKPVYCDSCFSKNKSRDADRAPKSSGNVQYGEQTDKKQLEAINSKLDRILNILAPAPKAETKVEAKTVKESKDSSAKKKNKNEEKAVKKVNKKAVKKTTKKK